MLQLIDPLVFDRKARKDWSQEEIIRVSSIGNKFFFTIVVEGSLEGSVKSSVLDSSSA